MRTRRVFAVLTVAGCCWFIGLTADAAPAGTTNALTRVVSASKQFIAYAGNPMFAAELCAVAENSKREWLRLFNLTDEWRDPVVLVVHERAGALTNAPPVRTQTYRSDLHLKYQIECVVPPPVKDVELLAGLLEVLCAEYANRLQPTVSGTTYVAAPVPLWLSYGLTESLIGRPELLLETVRGNLSKPVSASSLLAVDRLPVEGKEREAFLADSWVFTEGLLALPGGTEKMVRFLEELGARKSVSAAFNAVYQGHFPSAEALEKWWSVCLAGRSVSTVAQNLTAEDTARRLDAALMIRFPSGGGEKVLPLDDLWRQADQPWLREILQTRIGELQTLRSVAHPLYVGAIDLRIQGMSELLGRNFSRYRRSSAAARKAQETADQQYRALTVYVDEVEARLLPAGTNLFQVYFRIFEESDAIRRVRVDPIRDYLDRFDESSEGLK